MKIINMATYTITTQANSVDITKDGETREYPFNELIVQVDDLDVDTLTLFNKRSLIIDYYIYTTTDTIDVNGVTVFADAEALKTEIDLAIFKSSLNVNEVNDLIGTQAEQIASRDAYFGSTAWRTGVAGATLINEIQATNTTDGATVGSIYNYIDGLPKLKSSVINGNLDEFGASENWIAGTSLGSVVEDIPTPPQILIDNQTTRGFRIAYGDNTDYIRPVLDYFTLPSKGQYVKYSYYLYVEAGNYPPTESVTFGILFREALQYNITNVQTINLGDGVFKIVGYGLADFAEDITNFWLQVQWSGGDIRPSGDVYVTGFSMSQMTESPYFEIEEGFITKANERHKWTVIEDSRAKVATFIDKYINRTVDDNNQLTVTFVGDSIFGRQATGEISLTPNEATGHHPPNMWQQLISYKFLEAMQFNDADVSYYNMLAAEITETGTWSTGSSIDSIRTRRTSTINDYFEITVTGVSFLKFIYYARSGKGANFNVLINGSAPSLLGITGVDDVDTGLTDSDFKWANAIWSGLDTGTSYTFRFTNTNGTNTSVWGVETWSKPRLNVVNQGVGGETAANHKAEINKFSSEMYNPSLVIHELPLLNDSYDAAQHYGIKTLSSPAIGSPVTNRFITAGEEGTYTNFGGLYLYVDDYAEWNGSAWQKGSSVVDVLVSAYNSNIDYLNTVAESGVPTLIMSPHKTVESETRVWQTNMLKIARTWVNRLNFPFIDMDYKYVVENLNIAQRVVGDGTHLNGLGIECYNDELIATLAYDIENGLGGEGYSSKPKEGNVATADSRTVVYDLPYLVEPKISIQAYDDGTNPSFMYIESQDKNGFTVNGTGAFKWVAEL
jgi:hypothetical protein